MDNLIKAHKNARKGKGWYKEVKMIDSNPEHYLTLLQQMLINKTYKTSDYKTFIKKDGIKEREIFKLPYFPDRICQWAIMQVIEPILINNFTADTYSAIPKRGIHSCLKKLNHTLKYKSYETTYCLKMDIKKFYPSINHGILKNKYRKIFKDLDLLWLIDEIIDSTDGDVGIPIGNYLSQYSGNFYLSEFDHWIKEVKKVKYYFRYMDDIVILGNSKEYLHELRKEIDEYLKTELKLTVKKNWQIFPTSVRGIDFVGYMSFRKYILLRKSTCKRLKRKMINISNKNNLSYSDCCSVSSYMGWLKHCNSRRLTDKYIIPAQKHINKYYKKGGNSND